MFSVAPVLTEVGKTLLLRAAAGESFTFVKFQAGSGTMPAGKTMQTMTALAHVELGSIGITEADDTVEEGFIQLTASFDNQHDVQTDFVWTELGLIAKDESDVEYLYAYAYDGTYAQLIRAADSEVAVEQSISCVIAVGDTENITAYVLPHSTYALQADLEAHTGRTDNPHGVTYSQTGAAAASHSHSASDIAGGILPLTRGGTGVNTVEALKNLVAPGYVLGFYEGSGSTRKDITLGFQPSRVVIFRLTTKDGSKQTDIYLRPDSDGEVNMSNQRSAVCIEPGMNLIHYGCPTRYVTATTDEMLAVGHGGAGVTATGFAVGYYSEMQLVNKRNTLHFYIAWR